MEKNQVFTDRIGQGKRHFFIDAKKANNGTFYLRIGESTFKDGKYENKYILIFESEALDFITSVTKALEEINKAKEAA